MNLEPGHEYKHSNQKFGKNYEKMGKKFKLNVLVPFPLICPNSY